MNLPSPDALQRLDKLRQAVAQLTLYEDQGAPWSLRWFLYTGGDMLPKVRKVYYARFNQLLFGQTQGEMLNALSRVRVPPDPSDEYSPTYDTLKGYLVTHPAAGAEAVRLLQRGPGARQSVHRGQ